MNFSLICRLCGENKKVLRPIFVQDDDQTKNKLLDGIFYLCSLEPFIGDGLPENICKPCQRRLTDSCDFKKQIFKVEQNLKTILTENLEIKTEVVADDWEQLGEEPYEETENEKDAKTNEVDSLSEHESNDESYKPENDEDFDDDIVLDYESCDENIKDEIIRKTLKKEKLKRKKEVADGEKGDLGDHDEDFDTGDDPDNTSRDSETTWSRKRQRKSQKKLICPECGMLVSNGAFPDHMLTKHYEGEPQFPCDICGAKIKTKRLLWHHKRLKHQKRDKINCDQCGLIFSTQNNFKKHYNTIHLGIKNYHCPFHGCGKRFNTSSSLKRHKVTHTGERNYICAICDKALSTAKHLKRHMRQHNDERPYKCGECSEAFKHNVTLKLHVKRKHLGITAKMEKEKAPIETNVEDLA